jgi:hypothetical protein
MELCTLLQLTNAMPANRSCAVGIVSRHDDFVKDEPVLRGSREIQIHATILHEQDRAGETQSDYGLTKPWRTLTDRAGRINTPHFIVLAIKRPYASTLR